MRKKCRRKVYQLVDPIAHAIEGAALIAEHKINACRLLELSALDAMSKGVGAQHDWGVLAGVVNMCETLAGLKVGAEAFDACQEAEAALKRLNQRFLSYGVFDPDSEGLNAIREVYEYHDLQRQSVCTRD